MPILIFHVADIVNSRIEFKDFDVKLVGYQLRPGDIAAMLSSAPAPADPSDSEGWSLRLALGEREVEIDLPPLIPKSHPPDSPFVLPRANGSVGPLVYFSARLFAIDPLPRTPVKWSEIALRIRAFQQPDTRIDRPPVPDIRANDPPSHRAPDSQSVRQKYEGLVRNRFMGETGLLTRYFDANPGMDAQLIPIDTVVETIVALYSIELIQILEKEGYLWSILQNDIGVALRDGQRSLKVYQRVVDVLGKTHEEKILAEWDEKHKDDFVIDNEVLEKFLRRFGNTSRSSDSKAEKAWYDVLEISANASIADVREAYRSKIAQYHPDKVAALGPELRAVAETCTREIIQAYADARKARRL